MPVTPTTSTPAPGGGRQRSRELPGPIGMPQTPSVPGFGGAASLPSGSGVGTGIASAGANIGNALLRRAERIQAEKEGERDRQFQRELLDRQSDLRQQERQEEVVQTHFSNAAQTLTKSLGEYDQMVSMLALSETRDPVQQAQAFATLGKLRQAGFSVQSTLFDTEAAVADVKNPAERNAIRRRGLEEMRAYVQNQMNPRGKVRNEDGTVDAGKASIISDSLGIHEVVTNMFRQRLQAGQKIERLQKQAAAMARKVVEREKHTKMVAFSMINSTPDNIQDTVRGLGTLRKATAGVLERMTPEEIGKMHPADFLQRVADESGMPMMKQFSKSLRETLTAENFTPERMLSTAGDTAVVESMWHFLDAFYIPAILSLDDTRQGTFDVDTGQKDAEGKPIFKTVDFTDQTDFPHFRSTGGQARIDQLLGRVTSLVTGLNATHSMQKSYLERKVTSDMTDVVGVMDAFRKFNKGTLTAKDVDVIMQGALSQYPENADVFTAIRDAFPLMQNAVDDGKDQTTNPNPQPPQ